VIHAHEFYMSMLGAVISWATGVPLVVTLHGKSYYPDRCRRRLACRLMARSAAAVVAVSNELRHFFCTTTGAAPERVRVICNGIDLRGRPAGGRDATLLEAAGIPSDARLIGVVGNLYAVKAHVNLIRAVPAILRRHPGAHVVILGRGPMRDTLEGEAIALGIRDRIHLLGYRDDTARWLAAMDVFTMPSLSEGLPLALLEAMAAGLPHVVTRVGGMPEVAVEGKTGFVVEPGDVEALADRLLFLLDNSSLAARMGVAARARIADRFTVERMAAEYRDVYREAMGGR